MTPPRPVKFDDSGRRVPCVEFDWQGIESESSGADDAERVRQETLARLIDLLVTGGRTPQTIGRRVLLLAYLLKTDHAPAKTIRQLARVFRVSGPRVHQILTGLRHKLQCLQRD